jgi:fructose-bisphosphate aldolase/6-deoxy-5-ketofructose 1-phosphate synthase
MNTLSAADVKVPLDVPPELKNTYIENYLKMTHETGRLMLFAGDQKVEHLNKDFFGEGIAHDDADPIHLFNIASKAHIGIFAAQFGLINRYAMDFQDVPYLVKLNAKTNFVQKEQADPFSSEWISVPEVMKMKKDSGLNIMAVGYTVYYGSEKEAEMLHEAAELIFQAHQNGLLAIIWSYPRGKAVHDEYDPHVIAGAAGVSATLGADFVKIFCPKVNGETSAAALQEASTAAGRTGVVCMGGSHADAQQFFQMVYDQIHIGKASGNATGRNIHQRPLDEAIRFTNAIYSITIEDKTPEEAMSIYEGQ